MSSSVSFGGRPPVWPARRATEDPLGGPRGSGCARIPLMRRICELPVGLHGRRVERFGQAAEADASQPQFLNDFDQLLHGVRQALELSDNQRIAARRKLQRLALRWRSVTAPDNRSVKIFPHSASASASRCKARFWGESGVPE
jgi:hypothetical protein